VGFGEIYLIRALDLTLHRIVVGANYQRVLALIVFIFAKRLLFHDSVKLCVSDTCLYYVIHTILRIIIPLSFLSK